MDNNFDLTKCKPFDLQKCMNGDKVVTRDGDEYKYGCYNPDAHQSAKLIMWDNTNVVRPYRADGRFFDDNRDSPFDLFMAPDVRTVYVNVWKGRNGGVGYKYNISIIHETEQDAKVDADDCKDMVNFVAIAAPIEIEE